MGFPTMLKVSENQNPVAEAGLDKIALVTEQVLFDGSGSSDPDGYIAAWAWDFGDGSPLGTGTLVSHFYAQPGQFQVTLTVTDDDGATAVDQALVVVMTPITAVEDLTAEVKNSISGSLQNSLVSKLKGVLDSLNKKNDIAAINKLKLFIEEVKAQKGKKIPGDVADQWIAFANRIIAAVQAGANMLNVSSGESLGLLESSRQGVVETQGFPVFVHVDEATALTIVITDSKGNLVAVVPKGYEKAGDHIIFWGGRDLQGNPCPKGIYNYHSLGSSRPGTSGIIIIR